MSVENIAPIIDAVRSSVYSLAAILLPGALWLEVFRRTFRLEAVISWTPPIPYLALAYVVGFVLQGISSRVFLWKRIEQHVKDDGAKAELQEVSKTVQGIIVKRYDCDNIPITSTINVALTKANAHREVYDKFTALRDMARSLTVVFGMVALLTTVRIGLDVHRDRWQELGSMALVVFVSLLGVYGASDRYRRLQFCADKAILGAFVAGELKEKEQTAPTQPTQT